MVGSCTNGSWEDMESVVGVVRGRQRASVDLVRRLPGQPPHPRDDGARGAAGRPARRRRDGLGADLRLVRGHRPRPRRRHQEPARVQPQLPGPQRRQGRRDLPLLVGDGRGLRAHRRHHAIRERSASPPGGEAARRRFAASVAGLRAPPEGERRGRARGRTSSRCRSGEPVAESLEAPVLLKLGDKVSTDDISPSGTAVLVFRSNVPAIAELSFKYVDPEFVARARAAGRGIIVAGEIYGQGSSREAAALAPHVPGRARRAGQELRPHPPRQPHQLGHRAARRSTTRPPATPSSATTGSASTACARRCSPATRIAVENTRARGRALHGRAACSRRASATSSWPAGCSRTHGAAASDRASAPRGGRSHDTARDPGRLHARRHQPLPRLPRARPAGAGARARRASCSPRSAAPTPTGASSTGSAAASRRCRRRSSSGPQPGRTPTSTTRSPRSR